MPLPAGYVERVYAGVLGKLIGVYLGRPFEGWTYEQITQQLGEIWYYVHDRRDIGLKNNVLVVTDDDISGTFTFLRAIPDYNNTRDITPAQIGQTWLNYIIENRTILWWGGIGNSTEHTAYLHLQKGIAAPESGSIRRNGRVVAEQIGAQIFIDGWAMVAPGDPAFAAELARRAASVSHDGEAIYAAQLLAAMEAQAFVETNLFSLLECGLSLIPRDSLVARLVADLCEWRERDGDWRRTRNRIAATYGYDNYGGNCHVIPNHALIHLALLYGDDDLQKSLMIVNTSGWDTDCNSGNVGCFLGIKNGLAGLDAGADWRGPIADRVFLPTADGGRCITDAAAEALHVANIGRALASQSPIAPKHGARFHFELSGSVQGFVPEGGPESENTLKLENVEGHSRAGTRSLALHYQKLAPGRVARAATATFIPPGTPAMPVYDLLGSPTLHSGQTVQASLSTDGANDRPVSCGLYLRIYGSNDEIVRLRGPNVVLRPGMDRLLTWAVPNTNGAPIAEIGIEIQGSRGACGSVYLDYLTWHGTPSVTFTRPQYDGEMWRRAWVPAVDLFETHWQEPLRIIQNRGTGLLMQGSREWNDYMVSVDITPHLAQAAGLAARVQGLRRYYALLLYADGMLRLVKALDGERVLAEQPLDWHLGQTYQLRLEAVGRRLRAWVDDTLCFDVHDSDRVLEGGAIALVCTEGRVSSTAVVVAPPQVAPDQTP